MQDDPSTPRGSGPAVPLGLPARLTLMQAVAWVVLRTVEAVGLASLDAPEPGVFKRQIESGELIDDRRLPGATLVRLDIERSLLLAARRRCGPSTFDALEQL